MPKILVVVETVGGRIDDTAWELASLARTRLGTNRAPIAAAMLGHGISEQAEALQAWFDDVYLFDDPVAEVPDGVACTGLLHPLIERERFELVLIPHTNTGMDLAPRLATRCRMPLLADCLSLELRDEVPVAVRAMYGGKVHARIAARASEHGYLASLRPGSCEPSASAPGAAGRIHALEARLADARGRRYLETVAPESGGVDIGQAEILVAVGRGIEDEDNLEIVRSLAESLGAELACTRPVVDKGWLPKSRQVGTSGVTVKPKVYLALGLSGSFQHLGGIKGGPFIAAVNKDPAAPVFAVAQVGIVADLLDIVPLIEKRIRELKR